jgi:P27 family predicted phage terminase small subunit
MGRKPDPIEIRATKGNPQRRPMPQQTIRVDSALIDPPEQLTTAQKVEWKYLIANAPLGLLRSLDKAIMVTYITAWDAHRLAAEKVNTLGLMLLSKKTKQPYMNPYLAIMNKQAAIMIKCCSELGFTPASRTKLSINESHDQTDPLEAFYSRPIPSAKSIRTH